MCERRSFASNPMYSSLNAPMDLLLSCANYSSFCTQLEGHLEARLWNDIFTWTEQKVTKPRSNDKLSLFTLLTQCGHKITTAAMVKGMGHLDHVWSYGVREVVSSIPDRGNIVVWVFHLTQVTGTVSSSEHAFPSKFWIYLEHCPRGEAVIIGHLRLSSMR